MFVNGLACTFVELPVLVIEQCSHQAVFEGYRTRLAPLRTLLEAVNMALYFP